ncbi:F-box protein PP2-B10-like [Olea europaea var. sylvestris]|uniref:F-box protein PP2-B10-like n=1 Tax=Olea europaea var. sylvestris TaxID=158386 RepID=UPI000C1D2ABA|nr:F-box protein PP2-B10-like [Olea europaea var. sylvestris]
MKEENEILGFSALPEGCISYIISFTSPKDACIASAVSLGFKSAAESDTVWERFLPPDYQDIIAKSVSPVICCSKKELYFHLCDSTLLLDGGKLSLRLSKPSGKKCYMLCARKLYIAWGDNPMYWNWKTQRESRFAEVAELLIVCWLEICGKMQTRMLSLKTNYAAYLIFKTHQNSYGLDYSSKASVKLVQQIIAEVEGENNIVYLKQPTRRHGRLRQLGVKKIDGWLAKERRDGWMEIELGEYFNDKGDEGDIQMQLLEIEKLHWKGGLIIEGIELRPKEG